MRPVRRFGAPPPLVWSPLPPPESLNLDQSILKAIYRSRSPPISPLVCRPLARLPARLRARPPRRPPAWVMMMLMMMMAMMMMMMIMMMIMRGLFHGPQGGRDEGARRSGTMPEHTR